MQFSSILSTGQAFNMVFTLLRNTLMGDIITFLGFCFDRMKNVVDWQVFQVNRSFPSSLVPLFQNEFQCERKSKSFS